MESLQAAGQAHGFSVQVVDPVQEAQGEVISSSMVRRHLQAGDLDAAARLMGRPLTYSVTSFTARHWAAPWAFPP